MPFAAICFDLDGTLIDSAAGVALALNTALAEAGLPTFELPTVRSWIGDGPDALILRALAAGPMRDGDPTALAATLRRRFDLTTLTVPAAQGEAYPGIAALLARLAGRYPMAVVTNKPTVLARAVLQSANLLEHFAQVRGADVAAQRKPSPMLIQRAARCFGVSAGSVLMVGDGPADLAAAHAAGSPVAWASWGYGAEPPPGTWRLGAPDDLLAALPARAPTHH